MFTLWTTVLFFGIWIKIELVGLKTGKFGASVAIDGNAMVVGAPEVETWRMEVGQMTHM